MDTIQKKQIYGAILAHGTIVTNDMIMIPKGMTILCPTPYGKILRMHDGNAFGMVDIQLIQDHKGRQYVCQNNEIFELKKYTEGMLMENISLEFNLVFKSGYCYTTGIMTTGKLHSEMMHTEDFKSKNQMRDELMRYHDNAIVKHGDLWDKTISFGQVLKFICDSGMQGSYLGIFCRGFSNNYKEKIPPFSHLKVTEDLLCCSFENKIAKFEECALMKTLDQFKFDAQTKIIQTKLKLRICIDIMAFAARKELELKNIVSADTFHSIMVIHETSIIPEECIVKVFRYKLKTLVDLIMICDHRNIITQTTQNWIDSLEELQNAVFVILTFFQIKLLKSMISYGDKFDVVVKVAECIVNKEMVMDSWIRKIFIWADNLDIDVAVSCKQFIYK
jgi:hypothetical protein